MAMLGKLISSHRSTIELAANHDRLPNFGPLDIRNYKDFLRDSKAFFNVWSSSPFPYKLNLDHFTPLYDLGMGAYGRVILVKNKLFQRSYYAMKIISKRALFESDIIEFALQEKRVLQGLNCPFCIRLEYYTSDRANLYYLLPFMSGGELYGLVKKLGNLNENFARFYTAQIVLALEFMHYCNVIHRDLKPENILLDHFGYLKIADFGFAKVMNDKSRTYTFCGTPDYMAPEVILGVPYSFAADWWSVGVIVYEFVHGEPPFHDQEDRQTYTRITQGDYRIPERFSPELQDLIMRILQTDMTRRLGSLRGGVEDIKQHRWFKDIAWLDLLNRRIIPPYVPPSVGDFDTANFPRLKSLGESFTITSAEADIEKYFQDF